METDKKHPIGVVERQTGLSTHVIRKWEERYNAIEPLRNSTGRRLYSLEDISRLILLKKAVDTGRSIGQIVHLSNDILKSYIDKDRTTYQPNHTTSLSQNDIHNISKAYLTASKTFDDDTMIAILNRAYVEYGQNIMIDLIISDIMHTIGDAWHSGEIRIGHEHLATSRINSFLMKIFDDQKLTQSAPVLLSATLHDQHHTIGALLGAIIARDTGWKALYLGGNIPAVEIAGAVIETNAKVLLLSFTYPYNKLHMHSDLSLIKTTISDDIPIIIGGDPALQYVRQYNDGSCKYTEGLSELRSLLHEIYLSKFSSQSHSE